MAEPYGRFSFRVPKSLQTAFHSGYISLYSHQLCVRVPFALHPHQHCSVFFFFKKMIVTVAGIRKRLMIFICIFFMVSAPEQVFMCLIVHINFIRWKMPVGIINPFLTWIAFVLLSFLSSSCSWILIPYQLHFSLFFKSWL